MSMMTQKIKKLYKKLPVFIFLLLHLVFLAVAIFENKNKFYPLLVLTVIAVLLGFFYSGKIKADTSRLKIIDFILIPATILGAVLTYWLNLALAFNAVLAAALVGLVSSFLPFLNRNSDLLRELPVAIYCGAFAGMTAPIIAQGYTFIFLAGLISGVILVISKDTLHGYGGKLGSIAFGGVTLISLIFLLF